MAIASEVESIFLSNPTWNAHDFGQSCDWKCGMNIAKIILVSKESFIINSPALLMDLQTVQMLLCLELYIRTECTDMKDAPFPSATVFHVNALHTRQP